MAQAGDNKPFVYFLNQHDQNDKNFSQAGIIDTFFPLSQLIPRHSAREGNLGDRLKYGVEAAFEGGQTLSSSVSTAGGSLTPVIQTRNPIQAWAVNGRLDYLTEGPHQARFTGETILASGDHDRGTSTDTFDGSAPHTTDYGFNAFGLLNTGLAFTPEVSNLMVLRVGGSIFPLPDNNITRRLQIGADFFVFGKLLREAPIDEPTDK